MTPRVREILSWYGADSPGTLGSLARLLNHGRLGGTGKLVVLPVDQGFEHGPARSFAPNPPAYDPRYHFELAIEAGCSAYAAPLGFLEAGARDFAGEIPLILKLSAGDIVRWPDRLTGEHIRVEHWVVAERQGQVAAHNMLGRRERFDYVPFFWTEQYDFSLAYVGHAVQWDKAEISGSLEARDCAISYRLDGREFARAVVGRDLEGLRAELGFEKRIADQIGFADATAEGNEQAR